MKERLHSVEKKIQFWNYRSFSSAIRRGEKRGNFKTGFFWIEWSPTYIVLALVMFQYSCAVKNLQSFRYTTRSCEKGYIDSDTQE